MSNHQMSFIAEAKPVLKWAGGKSQLLPEILSRLPAEIQSGKIEKFCEPFIGGGAVFFALMNRFTFRETFISDVNPALVMVYRTIQEYSKELIALLQQIEADYLALDEEQRKEFFYQVRTAYNEQDVNFEYDTGGSHWVDRSAKLLFLNRTCFNGLFRQNSKGEFNVPFGKYKDPKICHTETILSAAKALQNSIILQGDFEACASFVDNKTFVYFDPPYRPISKTASFNAYSKLAFGDLEQLRLAQFFFALGQKGAKLMLSNSDPQNNDPSDTFFEDAFNGFNIEKIQARRNINSKAQKRGNITELLIRNYE